MLTRGRVMDDQAPLKVQSFATGKCEIASQSLQSIYARKDVRIDVFGKSQNFAMRTTCAAFGALTLVRSDVTDWRFTRDLNSLVLIKMPLFGSRLDYASGLRRQEAYPLRGAGVGRPFETVTMTRARGGSLSLYAPIERLIERAEALAGKSCGAALISKMADYLDLSAPVCAAFARAAKTAMAEMTSLDSIGLGALAVAGFEDMLLNLAAGSLFAGVIRKFDATPSNCGNSVIQRARDYIAEHAAGPIDLARLAADLGVSMRAMQENFRKCYGFSPRDFILDCRLERARQRLLAADATTSVTQVGMASGFTDLGHFSAKYRAKFGEPPSETLRFALRQFS